MVSSTEHIKPDHYIILGHSLKTVDQHEPSAAPSFVHLLRRCATLGQCMVFKPKKTTLTVSSVCIWR